MCQDESELRRKAAASAAALRKWADDLMLYPNDALSRKAVAQTLKRQAVLLDPPETLADIVKEMRQAGNTRGNDSYDRLANAAGSWADRLERVERGRR